MQGSSLTTIKIGGVVPSFESGRLDEILPKLAGLSPQEIRVIGGGSNLALPDGDLVPRLFKLQGGGIELADEALSGRFANRATQVEEARYLAENKEGVLALSESEQLAHNLAAIQGQVYIVADAGVPWAALVAKSLQMGLAGLQWYARIPCQVGGAVYNNIHGEKHLLSEVVAAVEVFNVTSATTYWIPASELAFGYDTSALQGKPWLITRVLFALTPAPTPLLEQAKSLYQTWTSAKVKAQPAGANCGSVFQNLTSDQIQHLPTSYTAAGWFLDQVGAKSEREGDLVVSDLHANFITNTGEATQAQLLTLIERLRLRVHQEFGVTLHPEVYAWDEYGNARPWQNL